MVYLIFITIIIIIIIIIINYYYIIISPYHLYLTTHMIDKRNCFQWMNWAPPNKQSFWNNFPIESEQFLALD